MNFKYHDTLLESLGINFEILSKEKVVATMPVDGRTKQTAGILHGGASAALVETVASIGSCLNINLEQQDAFGIELNISHVKAVREGSVTGEAIPVRIGRSLHVWDVIVHVTGDPTKIVAKGRCSVFVRDK